jgi:small-conductance mechanosensitive channel
MANWIESAANDVVGLVSGLLTDIIVAVILVLLGFIIGRVLGRLAQKALHEIETDRVFRKTANAKFSIEKITGNFVKYFTYFIFIVMALNQLGLTTTLLHMISAGIIILIVLAFFLGIKDFVPNFLAGLSIHRKGMIAEGDWIKVKNVEGKVVGIDLVETRIETKSKDTIYVPNSVFTKEEVVKFKRKR